jgi:polyhydroxybutyrate depolymerase
VRETLTIVTPDGPRRCLVHVPPGGTAALPALLFLHGAGGTAAWSLDETGLGATADREGFLVVLPEGARPDPSRPPGFLQNAQTWNDGAPGRLPDQLGADDVSLLSALLDELPRRYPLDPRRVYAAGFSNGAGMAFRLGAELSPRLAALAPVAGHCWQTEPRPVRALPTLYLVGSADPLVPLQGGPVVSPWSGQSSPRPPVRQTLERWAAALGCPAQPARIEERDGVSRTAYGPGRDGAELTAYVVEGLGHHWPGGRGQLNPRLAGPPSQRLRANDLLWDFFRRHALP